MNAFQETEYIRDKLLDKTSCNAKYNKIKACFSSEIIYIKKMLDAIHTRTKRIVINK